MNGPSPVTQSITTFEAPAAESAAPDPAAPEAPLAPAVAKPERDPNLDLARKFESVAQREGRARKAEREAQERAAAVAEREKKIAAREAELEEALGDPVGHLLKIGKDPVEVAKRYAQPETPEEKRIRKLEERDAAREEEAKRSREALESRQRAEAEFKAMHQFVGDITAKECPNLTALYEAREVPGLVRELLTRRVDRADPESPTMIEAFVAKEGRNPTDAEIRESLEYEAELRATRILRQRQNSAGTGDATANGISGPPQDSPKSEQGPNGISNRHAAATTATSKRPLSLEERRKIARRELTAALTAEAGDE